MYETLLRPQEVTAVSLPSIETAVQKLKKAEISSEERRLRQIETAKVRNKRKRDEATAAEEDDAGISNSDVPPLPDPKKRRESEPNDTEHSVMEEVEVEDALQPEPDSSATPANGDAEEHTVPVLSFSQPSGPSPAPETRRTIQMAHPFNEVRGHTSYLTFAVLLPYDHLTSSTIPESAPTQTTVDNSFAGYTTTTTDGHPDFAEFDEYFRSIPDTVRFPSFDQSLSC